MNEVSLRVSGVLEISISILFKVGSYIATERIYKVFFQTHLAVVFLFNIYQHHNATKCIKLIFLFIIYLKTSAVGRKLFHHTFRELLKIRL